MSTAELFWSVVFAAARHPRRHIVAFIAPVVSLVCLAGCGLIPMLLLDLCCVVAAIAYLLRGKANFVPWSDDTTSLCVDCHHPTAPNLTHHRQSKTPVELIADTSTEIVLNAAAQMHPLLTESSSVTCNHFDMDALGAVWAAIHPFHALERRTLLVECARLGDFRELVLTSPAGRAALVFNVWLNAIERERFWRPFHKKNEKQENTEKFAWFLPRCEAALESADRYGKAAGAEADVEALAPLRADAPSQFDAELSRVLRDAEDLARSPCGSVRRVETLGLAVLHPPRTMHYYALFGPTAGCDVVVSIYPGHRYGKLAAPAELHELGCQEVTHSMVCAPPSAELEQKYTGYVALSSRPCYPRLSLTPLAAALTAAERAAGSDGTWVADKMNDSGPLLRLEARSTPRLTKAQRYGHPYERDIASSALSPDVFEDAVVSFFTFGLRYAPPPRPSAEWTWAQLHDFNDSIDWVAWKCQWGPTSHLEHAVGDE